MEPFVALMRRYCIDYTNRHDQSVCDAIMHPGYVVHISQLALPRDAAYKPAVTHVFGRFPGLGLQVHERRSPDELKESIFVLLVTLSSIDGGFFIRGRVFEGVVQAELRGVQLLGRESAFSHAFDDFVHSR